MDGTIAIQEDRNVVDKFRAWYKEKLIDSGRSAKIEEGTVKLIDLAGDGAKIYAVVAGIVVAIVPTVCTEGALGPVMIPIGGLIATAGPSLMELCKKFGTKLYVNGKRAAEAIIIGEEGASQNVKIPDIDLAEEAKDIGKTILKETPEIVAKYGEYKAGQTTATQTDIEIDPNMVTDADFEVEIPTSENTMKM